MRRSKGAAVGLEAACEGAAVRAVPADAALAAGASGAEGCSRNGLRQRACLFRLQDMVTQKQDMHTQRHGQPCCQAGMGKRDKGTTSQHTGCN